MGSFGAGATANKIADNYMNEMVETALTLNNQEKQIFRQIAVTKNIDPDTVRGTVINREFGPDFMKDDICNRPERNARPFDDNFGNGASTDGIILDSKKK